LNSSPLSSFSIDFLIFSSSSSAVYPSEFGKERMEREETEGPPREIFASKKGGDSDDEDEMDSDEEEENIRPPSPSSLCQTH
jgi:hypothetical protein